MPDNHGHQKDRCEVTEKRIITSPPKPPYKLTEFLAWLKKRGATWNLTQCKRKCESEGFDLEDTLKKLDTDTIAIYISKGQKYVVLKNKPWADQWMISYNLEVPHHGQKQKGK